MNCPGMIRDFENSRFKAIIGMSTSSAFLFWFKKRFHIKLLFTKGATSDARGIKYAIALQLQSEFVIMRSKEVFEKWPMHLIDYLENQIEFQMPQQHSTNDGEINPSNAIGLPARIVGKWLSISHYVCFQILRCRNCSDVFSLNRIEPIKISLRFPCSIFIQTITMKFP